MADAARVAQSLVAKILSGYVKKNQIAPADVSALIATVHRSLLALTKSVEPEPERTPAVPIRRSVTPNYVVPRLWAASEDAAWASSKQPRADPQRVSGQMGAARRAPPYSASVLRTAIYDGQEDGVWANRASAATASSKTACVIGNRRLFRRRQRGGDDCQPGGLRNSGRADDQTRVAPRHQPINGWSS
jgi:hypothetical protein